MTDGPSLAPRAQRDWLSHDLVEFARIFDEHPDWAKPLGDARDPRARTRYRIVADLFGQIWDHVRGAHALLEGEHFAPLMAVQRATFEAITTLGYLVRHPHSADEAVILLACTHLRQIEVFTQDAPLLEERRRLLAEMPAELVAEAQRRMRAHPRTWSGKRVSQMASEGKVEGYASMYGYLSAHVHTSIVGEHVVLEPGAEGRTTLTLGRALSQQDAEAHANFARRALHGSFRLMWKLFDAPRVDIRSRNPDTWRPLEEWMRDHENATG